MNHTRVVAVLLSIVLAACVGHADDGCGDCGDPRFPEAAEFLASQGYAREAHAVLLTWSERAPLGDGQLVAGYRVRRLPDGRPFDVYSDEQGNLLDEAYLATRGIAPKNWDVRPVEQSAEVPGAVARTVSVRPKPVGVAASEILLVPVADFEAIKAEDLHAKGPTRIGVILEVPEPVQVDGDSANYGAWQPLADGDRVWSIRILSPEARGVRLHFESTHVPAGVRLIVFNTDNPVESYGPYGEGADLWSATCFSEDVTVECHVPSGIAGQDLSLTINEIIHVYADFGSLQWGKADVKAAGSCNNDVTCYPSWATTVTGVAGLGTVGSTGYLFCTGTLLADTVPGTNVPYVLTANHCVGSQGAANSVEVYWLYQTSTCDGTPPDPATVPRTTGGADFLATSPASTGTDFALLRLRNNPPGGVAYVGWSSAAAPVGTPLVCVHHPSGDFKRLTFGDVTNNTGEPLYAGHPRERFHQSLWSDGTTEPGSSGSPLFIESTQQVIGQLWGGLASCSASTSPDYYGRFDVTFPLIEGWLDPTGIEADFSSAAYTVSETAGAVTITVQLDSAPAAAKTAAVRYATSNGTAVAGSDYTSVSGTLTFLSGETQKTFQVLVTNDTTFELDETVVLTLSNPVGCALAMANNPATLTIISDDIDTDGDGISDYDESNGVLGYVTNPNNRDTDGDGVDDYTEILSGTDPTTPGNVTADTFEDDDTAAWASWIGLDPLTPQPHNFHDQGDEDWAKFYAHAGDDLRIETTGLGANCDTSVELYRADGATLVAANDNRDAADVSSLVQWVADADGIYLARVVHSPASPLPGFGGGAVYSLDVWRPAGPADQGLVSLTAVGATKAAIADTTFVFVSVNDGWTHVEHTNGTFSRLLPAGPYQVQALAQGYSSSMAWLTSPAGGSLSHTFTLIPEGQDGGCVGSSAASIMPPTDTFHGAIDDLVLLAIAIVLVLAAAASRTRRLNPSI